MTIDRLREALCAIGPPPDARELSEMLWLACHISPSEEQPRPAPPVSPETREEPAPPPVPPAAAPAPPPAPEPRTRLHPRPAPGAEPVGEAAEVLVPTAPMLADPLGVQRALRPLKRRVPSRHRFELDEDATAARIADTRLWTPVLVPSPERWLSLNLVVDTGPTMRLWRPLARELTETLLRQGAFQDVHTAFLDTTGGITATPDAPRQDPGTLLDASGRHAVLVLSDCSGPHWWNGRAARAVRRWAQTGPTAILQPLAERLWRRTAAPAAPGLAFLPRPAAPNTDLRFTPYDGAPPPGLPVPVLEPGPRWFAAWARLVSGSDPQPAAIATFPSRPPGTAPLHRERELPIGERVRRFLATATPDAAELAAHVAVSVPSLPVMRLIQHRILGGSGPGQLAEVLLSGLLRPAGRVRYEFVPGAREALLDTLPRPEAQHTRHVLEAVSAEIERRAGTSTDQFRALLPADGGPLTLTAPTDHFALLTPQTRTHLTPSTAPAPDLLDILGTPVDRLIGDHWAHPQLRPTAIGVDGNGGTVSVSILPVGNHGMIIGSGADRDAMLRTIVFSLALSHPPNVVTFAFADHTGATSLPGLENLPHLTTIGNTAPGNSLRIRRLPELLDAERRRREGILQTAGVDDWNEYQAAINEGRQLPPLPALIVILEDFDVLLDIRPDLIEPIIQLDHAGSPVRIQFIICSPADTDLQDFNSLNAWRVDIPGLDDQGPASLWTGLAADSPSADAARSDDDENAGASQTEAPATGRSSSDVFLGPRRYVGVFSYSFRPAQVDLGIAGPILELMRRADPQPVGLHQAVELARPSPDTVVEPEPESDVLRLNGGGPGGTFEDAWALPASTPRDPTIGHDADGNVVTLYPLDVSSGLPHGLVVGETEARQRVLRAITFALAASYSPSDLRLVFAGLGEHPLGEPIDLPHVSYSDDELLGRPDALDRSIAHLSAELDRRATETSPETLPRLLVVTDVSLTFPSSRREVGETLISLAQRGRALGVQLLLTSETVEDTTIWNRFLPLLGWRIAANRLPPAELRRVLGRASLPFPDERTAYLLAGGGTPRPFTVADEPPQAVVDDFLARIRALGPPEQNVDGDTIMDMLRDLHFAEADTPLPSRKPRHLVFDVSDRPRMLAAARLYGAMLHSQGVLSSGEVHEVPRHDSAGHPINEVNPTWPELFRDSRGGVLLLHLNAIRPLTGAFYDGLASMMDEHGDDPAVVLCGDAEDVSAFRRAFPSLADRFRRIVDFGEARPSPQRGSTPDSRVPIGVDVETDEAVMLDSVIDRHFLVLGPRGSGKTTIMRRMMERIATRSPEKLIYFVYGGRPPLPALPKHLLSHASFAEEFGIQYADNEESIARLMGSLQADAAEGREVLLFVLDHDLEGWQAALLRMAESGDLRLVVAHHEAGSGGEPDALVEGLRGLRAPALMPGYSGDLADLAVLIRDGIHRRIRLS